MRSSFPGKSLVFARGVCLLGGLGLLEGLEKWLKCVIYDLGVVKPLDSN